MQNTRTPSALSDSLQKLSPAPPPTPDQTPPIRLLPLEDKRHEPSPHFSQNTYQNNTPQEACIHNLLHVPMSQTPNSATDIAQI